MGIFMTLSPPHPSWSLEFHNVTLGYQRHPAVHHLSGKIEQGTLLAIVGPNGAGKSTLLKGIAGELRPFEGKIIFNGINTRQISYLTQQSTFDPSFPISVQDFVAMGLWPKFGAFRRIDNASRADIHHAIEAVGLAGLERRPIGQLSGGQVQRARFARLMLHDAPLVLLDEPYAAIDQNTVTDLAKLVRHWHALGKTVISVLHDYEHVRAEFPQSLLLAREIVAWGNTTETLSTLNLATAQRNVSASGLPADTICHTTEPAKPR